jgi:hypothetical protein
MSLTERIWAHVAKFSTFVAIILQAALYYPGGHTFDTDDQLHQATTGILNDWHPPLMAYTWRMLISLTGYSSSFLLLGGIRANCRWAYSNWKKENRNIHFFDWLISCLYLYKWLDN